MENFSIYINPQHTSWFYSLLYLFSFAITFIVLFYCGKKNNLPLFKWIVVVTVSFLFFSIGSRLIVLPLHMWENIFIKPQDIPEGRSVLGGMIGSLAGLLICLWYLNVSWKVVDYFSFVIPLGLVFTRMGCFLAGCCYGTPTDANWGVAYSTGAGAFHNHIQHNLIPGTDQYSLLIHPVQVYEIVGCLVILILLYTSRKHFKATGSLLVFSSLLYACLRFITEFFRDNLAYAQTLKQTGEINSVQVILIGVIILLILTLLLLESKGKQANTATNEDPERTWITLSIVTILYSLITPLFTDLDFMAINMAILPAWILGMVHTFSRMPIRHYPTAAFILLIGLFTTAQVNPEDKTDEKIKTEKRQSYTTILMGVFHGNHEFKEEEIIGGDCSGVDPSVINTTIEETYTVGGAGVSHTIVKSDDERYTFGLTGTYGKLHEKGSDNLLTDRTINYYTINPFFKMDTRMVGITGGLYFGDSPLLNGEYNPGDATIVRRYSVYPQLGIRIGEISTFFGEMNYANNGFGTFPASEFHMAIGSGFGKNDGSSLKIGTGTFALFTIEPTFTIQEKFFINPYLGFGDSMFSKFKEEDNFNAGLRLSYRIYHQPKN